jgi:tetratricopeptide (TPR) repeat protein
MMERAQDAFQALILREVLLADGLQGDIQKARLADWLGERLAQPATLALDYLVRLGTRGILSLPRTMTKEAIITFFQSNGSLYAIRTTRGLVSRLFKSREHTAHSFCRTALCYAVQGNYEEAESWLKSAEERVGDLARPNYIRGLMLGAQGRLADGEARFKESLTGRCKDETRARINEAAEALAQLLLPQPSSD